MVDGKKEVELVQSDRIAISFMTIGRPLVKIIVVKIPSFFFENESYHLYDGIMSLGREYNQSVGAY